MDVPARGPTAAHARGQAFSVEPVAALVARLLRPDGGQLLLADPLERTRPHRHAHCPIMQPCTTACFHIGQHI